MQFKRYKFLWTHLCQHPWVLYVSLQHWISAKYRQKHLQRSVWSCSLYAILFNLLVFFQRSMSALKAHICVSTSAPTQTVLTFAPASLATSLPAMDSAAQVHNIIVHSTVVTMSSFLTDINECTQGTASCDHNCLDTPGSYSCTCRPGYTLNADGFSCNGTTDHL